MATSFKGVDICRACRLIIDPLRYATWCPQCFGMLCWGCTLPSNKDRHYDSKVHCSKKCAEDHRVEDTQEKLEAQPKKVEMWEGKGAFTPWKVLK